MLSRCIIIGGKNPNVAKYEGTLRDKFIDLDGMKNVLLSYSITKEEYDNMISNKLN